MPSPEDRVREFILELPEVTETLIDGRANFAATEKTFAILERHEDAPGLALRTNEEWLGELGLHRNCYVPSYCVQNEPWIGLRLKGRIAWGRVEALSVVAYEFVATQPMRDALAEKGW